MRQPDGGYRLSGFKSLVAGGAQADGVLVTARTDAESRPLLFIVDTTAGGVQRRCYETLDGSAVADFQFDSVEVPAPLSDADHEIRQEERRVGKECVRPSRFRGE